MSTVKEELTRLIQGQPEDSSREEIVRELAISRNGRARTSRFGREAHYLK